MSNSRNITPIPEEFQDIAPYNDLQFKEKVEHLAKEPGFEHAVRYIMPEVDYDQFVKGLTQVGTQDDFQRFVMGSFLEQLEARTTDGITIDGLENCKHDRNYTFITNHRDIVLDASFLNLCFIRSNLPITEVAIGNNLLIYDWISDLVKLNRSFIVKRNVKMVQALEAARQLSAYIHYTINQLHESVWIAQREGRAKDSNDRTQESLMKMLALSGGGSVRENLLQINLCPVSISYEYDPNDYLKAREFLLKQRDPNYKKSQHDDLFSMETGILKYKGRVKFRVGRCINDELKSFESEARQDVVREACRLVDKEIHKGYEIYPCNYIAYDQLRHSNRFADKYTSESVDKFEAYIEGQLAKVDISDASAEEKAYMRMLMLTMYANPLKNKLTAEEETYQVPIQ